MTRISRQSPPITPWDAPAAGSPPKIHALTDQATCPVTVLLTAGQAGDNPQLIPLLDAYGTARTAAGTGKDSLAPVIALSTSTRRPPRTARGRSARGSRRRVF
jgi:transposase